MPKKKAFITGIGGQDGSYLAEHLLDNDYEVFGIVLSGIIARLVSVGATTPIKKHRTRF